MSSVVVGVSCDDEVSSLARMQSLDSVGSSSVALQAALSFSQVRVWVPSAHSVQFVQVQLV